ncbi:MAG: cellulase family glycosylhydrolase, partial [Micromonosporaceae bacterium]
MKLTRRRRGIIVLVVVAAVSALVAPSLASTRQEQKQAASRVDAAGGGGIFVRGNEVRRRTSDGNSHKFKTRGIIVEGFQFPLEAMRACRTKPGIGPKAVAAAKTFCERHVKAQDYYFHRGEYATDPLDAMDLAKRNWKANTVRFNLGQAMLDPKSALFNRRDADGARWGETYLRNLKRAVASARGKGMVVQLALFNYDRLKAAENVWVGDRGIGSYDKKSGVPTFRTKRAMQRLATAFKGDDEVLLEVYNEPWGNNTSYVKGNSSRPGVNEIV